MWNGYKIGPKTRLKQVIKMDQNMCVLGPILHQKNAWNRLKNEPKNWILKSRYSTKYFGKKIIFSRSLKINYVLMVILLHISSLLLVTDLHERIDRYIVLIFSYWHWSHWIHWWVRAVPCLIVAGGGNGFAKQNVGMGSKNLGKCEKMWGGVKTWILDMIIKEKCEKMWGWGLGLTKILIDIVTLPPKVLLVCPVKMFQGGMF